MSPRHLIHRMGALGRSAGFAIAAILYVGSAAQAAEGDDRSAVRPATQPSGARVAVNDFQTNTNDEEVVTALRQQLVQELERAGYEAVSKKADRPAADAARDADARYAVTGHVHTVGDSVQIAGQVSQVNEGLYAPVKATGAKSNYFVVQEDFIRQVKSALASATSGGGRSIASDRASSGMSSSAGNLGIPPASGSYWAGYAQTAQASPQVMYAPTPPSPPPPPLYGGYRTPYYGGGGGYYDYGYPLAPNPFPNFVGTIRTERLGQLGVSIIPPPASNVGLNNVRPAPGAPTPIPAHNAPIRQYKNPNSRFAAPVGQPQRAAPPNLRPGTDGSN